MGNATAANAVLSVDTPGASAQEAGPEQSVASLPRHGAWPLSAGEVNFLWWFMQGSIMHPETRKALRAAWGLCDRHGAAWLAIEATLRHCYFHGPAIVFAELMAAASHALRKSGTMTAWRISRALRARGACPICGAGIGPSSPGFVPGRRLELGRDRAALREFMNETGAHWRDGICGLCEGSRAPARCRAHLLEDLAGDPLIRLAPHREFVKEISTRLGRFEHSFRWERRGTLKASDKAALISAVGWCCGWRALLEPR